MKIFLHFIHFKLQRFVIADMTAISKSFVYLI